MAVAAVGIDFGSGGVAVKAAGLVAADTAHSGVFVGRGLSIMDIKWTASEEDSSDELYVVQFQFNTLADTGTWYDGPSIAFGKGSALGGQADTAASGEQVVGIFNPYDNQVRVKTWVSGTIATGFNYSVDAYPDMLVAD